MTFSQFIETVRNERQVPQGVTVPRASVILPSAEGYVGRHEKLSEHGVPSRDRDAAIRLLKVAMRKRDPQQRSTPPTSLS